LNDKFSRSWSRADRIGATVRAIIAGAGTPNQARERGCAKRIASLPGTMGVMAARTTSTLRLGDDNQGVNSESCPR